MRLCNKPVPRLTMNVNQEATEQGQSLADINFGGTFYTTNMQRSKKHHCIWLMSDGPTKHWYMSFFPPPYQLHTRKYCMSSLIVLPMQIQYSRTWHSRLIFILSHTLSEDLTKNKPIKLISKCLIIQYTTEQL